MKNKYLLVLMAGIAIIFFALFTLPGLQPTTALAQHASFAAELDPSVAVQAALREADLIVRARVTHSKSAWDVAQTAINSRNTLAVRYMLRGTGADPFFVVTEGGYLPSEELYMLVPELPTLSAGEEVILFLARAAAAYEIAAGRDGKYLVRAGQVLYDGMQVEEPISAFYARLGALDPALTLPSDWASQEGAIALEPVVDGMDYVYQNLKWPTNQVGYNVNLNAKRIETQAGSSVQFLTAIQNAAATWSLVGGADFTLTYMGATQSQAVANNRSNDIFFQDYGLVDGSGKAQPLAVASVFFRNSEILDSDIRINDAYNWNATGSPDASEVDLESVILHEMGHWLSLGHDPDNRAIMYYSIRSGTLKRALFDNDRRGIEFIYPCAAEAAPCNPAPTATSTPTITPTPTVTPTPYATPKPIARAITRDSGGELDYAPSDQGDVSVIVPPFAVITDTVISIHHAEAPLEPPARHRPLLDYFRVLAEQDGAGVLAYEFSAPVTLTVSYGSQPAGMAVEREVTLYQLAIDEAGWEDPACGPTRHDASARTVTTSICRTSLIGVFAVDSTLYLPVVQR